MGYMQDIEHGLLVLLTTMQPQDQQAVMRWVKAKILESYHNGMAADKNGTQDTPATPKPPRKFARRQ